MRSLRLIFPLVFVLLSLTSQAQELDATIDINTQRIQGTNKSAFDNLKTTLTQFVNDHHWTDMQFAENERIKCTFSIICNKYNPDTGLMTCEAYIQSTRPVFNSSYTTTTLSIHDKNFNFDFQEFDQLEFRDDQVEQNLTALFAFYAYLIIGIDMDTMAPEGGTEILQKALDVANNAQNINTKGWKAFDDNTNRFAVINDYLDGTMKPFRQMQYDYHRKGLDAMTSNKEQARQAITESLTLLKTAYTNKSRSTLPRLFTEYKRDELVGIYNKQETSAKKQEIYDNLIKINASQSAYWKKILE